MRAVLYTHWYTINITSCSPINIVYCVCVTDGHYIVSTIGWLYNNRAFPGPRKKYTYTCWGIFFSAVYFEPGNVQMHYGELQCDSHLILVRCVRVYAFIVSSLAFVGGARPWSKPPPPPSPRVILQVLARAHPRNHRPTDLPRPTWKRSLINITIYIIL